MKILSFGEILFDIFGEESKIGGAPFNFAAHATRAGAEAYLMSAVGLDELGDIAIQKAEHHKVRAEYISRSDRYGTGVCRVTLDGKGMPQYNLVSPAAYDDIPFNSDIIDRRFDGLYFGTLALRDNSNRRTLEKVISCCDWGEIFVDVNVRAPFCNKESLLLAFENATIVKISDEELPFVMQEVFSLSSYEVREAMETIVKRFARIKLVIVTCGADGSVVYDKMKDKFYSCPAVKTEVVSTVGAGDSFAATFMVNYMNGEPIFECMQKASRISAYVVSQTEAIPE